MLKSYRAKVPTVLQLRLRNLVSALREPQEGSEQGLYIVMSAF